MDVGDVGDVGVEDGDGVGLGVEATAGAGLDAGEAGGLTGLTVDGGGAVDLEEMAAGCDGVGANDFCEGAGLGAGFVGDSPGITHLVPPLPCGKFLTAFNNCP